MSFLLHSGFVTLWKCVPAIRRKAVPSQRRKILRKQSALHHRIRES